MKTQNVIKIIVIVAVIGLGAGLFWKFNHLLDIGSLAEKESQLIELKEKHGLWLPVFAGFIYMLVTGLSLPGALILSLLYGWYFKFWTGLLIVSFASTGGATMAFFISRYFLRGLVESKFQKQLSQVQDNLNKEGAYYLFSMRLIPVIPFFIINLVMGLTKIKSTTFWWVSQLGMLPGTAVIIFAGSGVPSLNALAQKETSDLFSLPMMAGFVLLGVFPILVKKLKSMWESRRTVDVSS